MSQLKLNSRTMFIDYLKHLINHFPASGVRFNMTFGFDPRKGFVPQLSGQHLVACLIDHFCETATASEVTWQEKMFLVAISVNASVAGV